jgi:hypothetical protein
MTVPLTESDQQAHQEYRQRDQTRQIHRAPLGFAYVRQDDEHQAHAEDAGDDIQVKNRPPA